MRGNSLKIVSVEQVHNVLLWNKYTARKDLTTTEVFFFSWQYHISSRFANMFHDSQRTANARASRGFRILFSLGVFFFAKHTSTTNPYCNASEDIIPTAGPDEERARQRGHRTLRGWASRASMDQAGRRSEWVTGNAVKDREWVIEIRWGKKNKLYQHRSQIAKTNFCVINVENSVTFARSSRQNSLLFSWVFGWNWWPWI